VPQRDTNHIQQTLQPTRDILFLGLLYSVFLDLRKPVNLAVPNVTAHPLTGSVPISVLLYNGPLFCGFNVPNKWLNITYRTPGHTTCCTSNIIMIQAQDAGWTGYRVHSRGGRQGTSRKQFREQGCVVARLYRDTTSSGGGCWNKWRASRQKAGLSNNRSSSLLGTEKTCQSHNKQQRFDRQLTL